MNYCLNCDELLDGVDLGWRCHRISRPIMAQSSLSRAELERDERVHRRGGDSSDASLALGEARALQPPGLQARPDRAMCDHYNKPDVTLCGGCEEPRDEGEARPACPFCQQEIPPMEKLQRQRIIIAGPGLAGKSHYIVALETMWRTVLGSFYLSPNSMMSAERKKNFDALKKWVLHNRNALLTNTPGQFATYSWCIRRMSNGEGLLFSFNDRAGEDLGKFDVVRGNRHFNHAGGIILVLDGERIALEQGLISGELGDRDPEDNYQAVMTMISALDHHRCRAGQSQFSIPLAVCINKMDILESAQDGEGWKAIFRDHKPNHLGGFDWETIEERSLALWKLLVGETRVLSTRGLANELTLNFETVVFFPMSTIGSQKRENFDFKPVGVEDPFLWLLHVLKMID
jgi:hypothetical protein